MIDYPGLRFGEACHDVTEHTWDEREAVWRSRAWSVLTRSELRRLLDDRSMLLRAASDAQVREGDLLAVVAYYEAMDRYGKPKWETEGTAA